MVAIRRILVLVAAVCAVIVLSRTGEASPAEFHLRLLKSQPAADTTLEAVPQTIELWFSETPEVKVTTIQMTAPGAQSRKLEEVVADEEDATHIVAPAGTLAANGTYAVTWRTMSKDGHVVTGEFKFSVQAQR